jgi:hypothetical protein
MLYAKNLVKDWHVSEKVSCSDHRYIRFTVMGINHTTVTYRNPRRTDWDSFRTDLSGCLNGMTDKINNCTDLEMVANQFQDAFAYAYNENCPLTVRRNTRNTPWWNQDLAVKRRKVRRLFNVAKKSGNWTDYKITLTEYNKALRQAKRESWRRQCEEIEKAPEYARLHRILSKVEQSAISSMGTTPIQRKGHWRSYSGSTSLVQKLYRNLLEAGTVLNWSFRTGLDPGQTGHCPEGR